MTITPHRGNDVLSPPFCKGYISFSFFNKWAIPPSLTSALHACLDTTCELFANPLNSSMNPSFDYCSAFQGEAIFGALFDASSYRRIGSCLSNPEYEPVGIRKTISHALACAASSANQFLVILILPSWEDSPWRT
jgi:hypothetical protein